MKTHMVNPNFVLMHEQCALWSSGLYFFEDEDTGINASKDPVNLYPVVLEAF
jgi:hypothetical protein